MMRGLPAACVLLLLALPSAGYELIGTVDPAAVVPVILHGASTPFEASTESDAGGRFRFRKLAAGTYTLAISTAAPGGSAEDR